MSSLFKRITKRVTDLEQQIKTVDSRLENLQKSALTYGQKVQNTTEKIIKTAETSVKEIDKTVNRIANSHEKSPTKTNSID